MSETTTETNDHAAEVARLRDLIAPVVRAVKAWREALSEKGAADHAHGVAMRDHFHGVATDEALVASRERVDDAGRKLDQAQERIVGAALQMGELEAGDLSTLERLRASMATVDEWDALCEQYGKLEARRLIAAKLRAFADRVERGDVWDGDVMAVRVERVGEAPCTGTSPMEDIAITLSRPWGG